MEFYDDDDVEESTVEKINCDIKYKVMRIKWCG